MHKHSLDYTITFQHLSQASEPRKTYAISLSLVIGTAAGKARLTMNDSPMDSVAREVMNQHNPVVIPRNHHVELMR